MFDLTNASGDFIDIWGSWMLSMGWQVAILTGVLTVSGILTGNCSSRFHYSLWTLVPIRLLLPPSLALITGWGWWLLPRNAPIGNPNDAGDIAATADLDPDLRGTDEAHSGAFSFDPSGSQLVVPSNDQPIAAATRGTKIKSLVKNVAVPEMAHLPDHGFHSDAGVAQHPGAPSDRRSSVFVIVFVVWLSGVSMLIMRLVSGHRHVRNWVRQSIPVDSATDAILRECCQQVGIRRGIEIRVNSSVWTPMVTGLFRPVILVPQTVLQSLNAKELRAVIVHELQHVVRHDYLQEILFVLLRAIYFFHPCVWIAHFQLRRLREEACDEATVAVLDGRREDYGSGFVKVAEFQARRGPLLTLGIVDSDEHTSYRLRRILDPKLRVGRRLSWPGLLMITLLGFVLIPAAGPPLVVAGSEPRSTQENESVAKPAAATEANLPGDMLVIGDESVEPTEITGQILSVDATPASRSIVRFDGYSRESQKWSSLSLTTDKLGQFKVRMRVSKRLLPNLKVSAMSADGSQRGAWRFPQHAETNKDQPSNDITIPLVASRVARVKVVDKSGAAIVHANVAMRLPYPLTTDTVLSDKDGIAELVIPANERIHAVIAWKEDAGLDYRLYELARYQAADLLTSPPEFPESGLETLVLDGVSEVTIRVRDEGGHPLSDVKVYPLGLRKKSENERINTSYFVRSISQLTAADGKTTFAWLPSWQTEVIPFYMKRKGYAHQRGTLTPGTGKAHGQLNVVMTKLVPIRGHVRNADGTPAASINVSANGAAYTFGADRGRATTTTNKDGSYELFVPPNQAYLVVASTDKLAAATQSGFAVFRGRPVEDKDFTLQPATRIHGVLLDNVSRKPVPNKEVFVRQYGQGLDSQTGAKLPLPSKFSTRVRPMKTISAITDERGRFEFFVGNGSFEIRSTQQESAETFEIHGGSEYEFIVTTSLQENEEVELIGNVTDESSGTPWSGVKILGLSRDALPNTWQATTNSAGEFRVNRLPVASFMHAESADQSHAAIQEVAADQTTVAFDLQRTGNAHGRLLKAESNEPWGGQPINFAVWVPGGIGDRSRLVGGRVTTAADGSFRLENLVPGWKYQVEVFYRNQPTITRLGSVTVSAGESRKMGDVSPSRTR